MNGERGELEGAGNSNTRPVFSQLSMLVRDLDTTVAFYRRLGLSVQVAPGGVHARATIPGGLHIEWDTAEFAAVWDSGSRGPVSGSTVFGFAVATRQAVDDLYAELTAAGYGGHQVPYDAFWGARYAIVDDPDGNGVGLMSPVAEEHRSWPPTPAPPGATRRHPAPPGCHPAATRLTPG
jgi:catechol 2,3-dioxygenase-like lactoylglutathione lyase family enzyme